jgi:hypothetical protein
LDWESKQKTTKQNAKQNTMKKLFFFAALVIGLSSCSNIETRVLTVQRMDGKVQQIESTISMNVQGDSIMVADIYSSSYGSRTKYYGNLGFETPEDSFSSDSSGTFSIHYEPAVVLKVE